jgi:hypothetical protein
MLWAYLALHPNFFQIVVKDRGTSIFLYSVGGPMKELYTEIEIEAPAEKVWQVLTDFAHFSSFATTLMMAGPCGI